MKGLLLSKLFRIAFICMTIVNGYNSVAQSYYQTQFRAEDGLTTEIVKTIAQDKMGFIWIGTDDGLVQYDGFRFTSFKHATTSSYIKSFFTDNRGELYVIDDMGVTHIQPESDTLIFNEVLDGANTQTDGKVWFPKSAFVDSFNNMWFGEPQSVSRYDGSTLKRYAFDDKENSTSFIRSFNFSQINSDSILISSFPGNFFIYQYSTDSIIPLLKDENIIDVFHMLMVSDRIFIATSSDVWEGSFHKGSISFKRLNLNNDFSYLLKTKDNQLIASSSNSGLYQIDLTGQKIFSKKVTENYVTVNQIFESKDKNIWVSSEKGVISLLPTQFKTLEIPLSNLYIESIFSKPKEEDVYFLSKEHFWKYEGDMDRVIQLSYDKNGYYLSGVINDLGIWTANGSSLFHFLNDVKVDSFDFSHYGRYIFSVTSDSFNNLWMTQEANPNVICFDPVANKTIIYKLDDLGSDRLPTTITIHENGVYVGTSDPNHYIYFKSHHDKNFAAIGPPFEKQFHHEFRIEAIEIYSENVWIGTSSGLFKYGNNNLKKIEFNTEFENLFIRSIAIDHNIVWFGNSRGLFRYNKYSSEYSFYNEKIGLPSNSVNNESIILHDNRIWVGTSSGIAVSKFSSQSPEKTEKPVILNLLINGNKVDFRKTEKKEFPSKSYLEINYSSPSYPAKSILYSYRIPELDSSWSTPLEDHIAKFAELPGGEYQFEVRAKKTGNYVWSDHSRIEFIVDYPFDETAEFYILVSLAALILIFITRYLTSYLLRKRQENLEKLVQERTIELENVNASLASRNEELDRFVYSTSHDLSAPLKSILGLINVFRLEPTRAERFKLIDMMEKSIFRLESFIHEIVDYSRNSRNKVKYKEIALEPFIHDILENHTFHPNYDKIDIRLSLDMETVITDQVRLKIIFNNLISNAIKFIDHKKKSFLHIKIIHSNGNTVYTFEDNGIGIPDEYSERIFEMFFRANDKADGSGLGLYITNECVKKLNGRIHLNSERGKGTTFTLEIPTFGKSGKTVQIEQKVF